MNRITLILYRMMRDVRSLLILCLLSLLPIGTWAMPALLSADVPVGPADGDGKRVLHGRVTDEKGEPLPGVAVPDEFCGVWCSNRYGW